MTTLTNLTKKNKIRAAIFGVLSVIWTGFIISMSTQNAEKSTGVSRGILKSILLTIYKITNIAISPDTVHNLFRKLAHFTEFFILGLFVVLFLKSINKNKLFAVIYGFIVAFSDELTQLFMGGGRSMQFSDMLIDISGVLFAVLIIYFISKIKCYAMPKSFIK